MEQFEDVTALEKQQEQPYLSKCFKISLQTKKFDLSGIQEALNDDGDTK